MAVGRKTGGRQKGVKNKRTVLLEQVAAQAELSHAVGKAIPKAFRGDAHAFLMSVYKDPRMPLVTRIDAAAKAIRFEIPTIGSIEANRGDPPATQPVQAVNQRNASSPAVIEIVNRFRAVGAAIPPPTMLLKR